MGHQGATWSKAAEQLCRNTSMPRVKVYRLVDGGKWDDHGTGHVTIDFIEGSEELALTVVAEEDSDTLLLHRITSDDIYRKQEETIISWRDPERALELALSFQEAAGCSHIWESMRTIQRKLQFKILASHEVGPRPALNSVEACRGSVLHDDSSSSVNGELKELPPLELPSLPLILKAILERGITNHIHVTELILQDHDFFPKLVNLFRTCERLGNMDGLHMIFRLVKGIIMLNNSEIFDKIFSDNFILDIIGALEYDPEVRNVQNHRAFLKEHVVFKEVIPIRNASTILKIHQLYRIGYIKDVILARGLDDGTQASLSTIIHANNATVICLLKNDASFIQELFAKIKSSDISAESKNALVQCLHEFFTLSKSLQPVQQMQLYRDLASEGVFDVISDVLQSRDKVLVSAGTDILVNILNHDPNLLKSYIARQEQNFQEGNSLLGLLVQGMVTDFGEEMHCHFPEILRILLDGFAANTVVQCREIVIEVFYEKHLDKLIDVIVSSCPPKSIVQSISGSVGIGAKAEEHCAKPEILSNICELLSFCVVHHPYKIKLNFFSSNSLDKILTLTRRKEGFLVVAAIRFMRIIIGRKDELLINHVIKFNLFKPVIEAFIENGDRYNMLHSVVLELLEYIRKENLKALVVYVVDSFWSQLVKFEQLASIQAIKITYQQSMESAETKQSSCVVGMRMKSEEIGVYKEEHYFDKKRDEEYSARQTTCVLKQPVVKSANASKIHDITARPKSRGLVDYDNDNEKDQNPPPNELVDEDDQALNVLMVKRGPVDGIHTDGKDPKKPKLESRISCANIDAVASVAGRHSDMEDKRPSLLALSTIAEGNDDVEGSTCSQIEQSISYLHQTGDDCTKAAGNLSPKTVVNTTKGTDSESHSAR